jgi:hypothetical protein
MASGSKMRVIILALVGAFIGIMCIITPWTTVTQEFIGTSVTNNLNLTDYMHEKDSTFALAIVLFILGCAFAFITPFGGVAQFFGWLIFLGLIYQRLGTVETGLFTTTTSLNIGLYIGVASAVIVLFSMIRPMGWGYGKEALQPRQRFLVWSD